MTKLEQARIYEDRARDLREEADVENAHELWLHFLTLAEMLKKEQLELDIETTRRKFFSSLFDFAPGPQTFTEYLEMSGFLKTAERLGLVNADLL